MEEQLELSSTDQNAIRFLVFLVGLMFGMGTGRAIGGDPGMFYGGLIGGMFAVMAGVAAPSFYQMTMKDSVAVLKVSLLIGLAISFVGVFSANLAAPIAAVVFLVSPVLYDFIRDIAFPNVPKHIPWSQRSPRTRLLELVLEAAIGAAITAMISLAIVGHL
jgi:hypothetical protein